MVKFNSVKKVRGPWYTKDSSHVYIASVISLQNLDFGYPCCYKLKSDNSTFILNMLWLAMGAIEITYKIKIVPLRTSHGPLIKGLPDSLRNQKGYI